MKTKNPFAPDPEFEQAVERGRSAIRLFANQTQTDALRDAQDSADRASIEAHHDSAEAQTSNDPIKNLEAAKSHVRARDKHAGLASFHKSFGNKSQESKAEAKAADHQKLAKEHATKASELL